MKRCAQLDDVVTSQAVEECLVFLQKNKERYQLQADGEYVDLDAQEVELGNFQEELRTNVGEAEAKKKVTKHPGINGEFQSDLMGALMNKIKQHSTAPAETPNAPE